MTRNRRPVQRSGSLPPLLQLLTKPKRIAPHVEDCINVGRVAFNFVIDPERESSREHPIKAKMAGVNPRIKNKRVEVRQDRLNEVIATSRLTRFIEVPANSKSSAASSRMTTVTVSCLAVVTGVAPRTGTSLRPAPRALCGQPKRSGAILEKLPPRRCDTMRPKAAPSLGAARLPTSFLSEMTQACNLPYYPASAGASREQASKGTLRTIEPSHAGPETQDNPGLLDKPNA